ncbi:MAG: protein kinase [Alphaproteobacteria bacterium]|nr:protein kinase [Alphaproteobacteria bacterium]
MIGTFLDKYEVLQKVGEGGMATVYRGRHVTLGREVAIKVLHPHLSASSRNRKRFAREARAIEHLDHDNILKIYDYSGVDVDDCYIVTEFVEGRTLLEMLDERGLLPSEVVAGIALRLADALAYAHTAGIIHRDLKLENVMVRCDGTVKLMDFGIARFLDESTVTMTGALVGSPAYMSPEQALEKVVDARSDLFSLGTVLFQLVTGQLPYSGSNPSVILRNIIEGTRPEVLELQPGASPRLADAIERLLQIDPDNRFTSAEDVKAAMLEVLEESDIRLDAPQWALTRYLLDPDDYEARLRSHLDQVLLDRGREAFARGDHLGAQRLLNRLLVQDPDHPEVLTLLSDLHQPPMVEAERTSSRWSVWLGALALLLGAVGAWVMLRPEPPPPEPPAEVQPEPPPVVVADPEPTAPLPISVQPAETQDPPIEREDPHLTPRDLSRRPPVERPDPVATLIPPRKISPPPDEAPAEASVTVRLTQVTWADVFLDGERQGQVRDPLTLKLPPGSHTLTLTNPYVKDYTARFDVAAGEQKTFDITLVKKPVTATFVDTVDGGCAVRVDGQLMGTVASLGRGFDLQDPDVPHMIGLECPDGSEDLFTVKPREPGSVVLLPP